MKLIKLGQAQEFSNSDKCTIAMPCTPAWYPEQHKLIEE